MKTLTNHTAAKLAAMAMLVLGTSACDPFKENRAIQAEQTRIACLDKPCYGDDVPKVYDLNNEVLKLNGQWYVAPKKYVKDLAGVAFYWPSKTPVTGLPDGKLYPEKGQDYYDVAIEIFLTTKPTTYVGKSMYQALLDEERQGNLIEKRNLTPGLDAWRIKSLGSEETWFIATHLTDPSGDPPTISCRSVGTDNSRCSGGFIWIKPDVGASLRFRATHGPDWPEIYLETVRVLALIKKV